MSASSTSRRSRRSGFRNHHYEDWPPDEWRALYRDILAAIGTDPSGPGAQSLVDRWLAIVQGASSLPAIRTGMIKAWIDREHWPESLRRRVAELDIERATRFIGEALWERWEAERAARECRYLDARNRFYRAGGMLF